MSTTQPSTVLIAEDDHFICDLLIEALHDEGYAAECLLDAPSVLARLGGGNVCLMLVDLLMPGQDGLSIIRQVAAEGAPVPIVAMSASDLHLAEAVAAGDRHARQALRARRSPGHRRATLRRPGCPPDSQLTEAWS